MNKMREQLIKERLKINSISKLDDLKKFINIYKKPKSEIKIALCGKYTELIDSYKSVLEAFVHAGVENNVRVLVEWVKQKK